MTFANGESLDKPGLASWRRRFRLRLPVDGEERVFYLKQYDRPPSSAQRAWRRAGGDVRSLAGLEWTWTQRLAREGVSCPRPIALGEQWRGRREVRSAIIVASVSGTSLEQRARDGRPLSRAISGELLGHSASLIARLHQRGYVHRDLYLSHIFFDPDAAGDRLHLIDLQRVFRPRRMRRWIVKDLAALHASTPDAWITRTDRLRWLKFYLGLPKLNPAAKRLAFRVIGKTQALRRRERRRRARHGDTTNE